MKRMLLALVVATAFPRAGYSESENSTSASITTNADTVSELVRLKYSSASEVAAMFGIIDRSESVIRLRRLENFQQRPNTPFDENKLSNLELANLQIFGARLARKYGPGTIEREIKELNQCQIEVHARINALTLTASSNALARIKNVIAKMDFLEPQFLVEAVIIEFQQNDSNTKRQIEVQPRPGLTALSDLGIVTNTTFPFRPTNALVQATSDNTYIARLHGDLDAIVKALTTNPAVMIVQRPRIQTPEGEPAQFFVGASRPYPGGYSWNGGAFSGYSSIRAVNIGRTLEVNIIRSAKDQLQLEVNKTTESANGSVNIANVGTVPITKSDETCAQMLVHDGETLAIGGMLETNTVSLFSEIDQLADVPGGEYVNKLISYPKRTTRSELVVLLRVVALPEPKLADNKSKDALLALRSIISRQSKSITAGAE